MVSQTRASARKPFARYGVAKAGFGGQARGPHAVLRSAFGTPQNGPVAQLGARLNGIQEVTGSIPVRSTTFP